jgi:hypothetical protein
MLSGEHLPAGPEEGTHGLDRNIASGTAGL